MNVALITQLRQRYGYPAAHLVFTATPANPGFTAWGTVHLAPGEPLRSSVALDNHHFGLMHSQAARERAIGAVSAVYWGHYADRNGNPNGYSMARAAWTPNGKSGQAGSTESEIARIVETAVHCTSLGQVAAAWSVVQRIKCVGKSFASKLVMFMNPQECSVLDNVVLSALNRSGHPIFAGMKFRPNDYQDWCGICSKAAVVLNAGGHQWQDWDGSQHAWRAVDVERAIFAYTGDPMDMFTTVSRSELGVQVT